MIEYTEETFPYNNWYLQITEDTKDVINNWRINIIKAYDYPCRYNYISYLGAGGWEGDVCWVGITFNDFKKFVLKEQGEPAIVNENYNYLTDLFNKLEIK